MEAPPVRYGEQRRFSARAVILTALFHAALLASVLQIRSEIDRNPQPRLTVVNLTPPPAPPPPPSAETPPAPEPPTKTPPAQKTATVLPSPVIPLTRAVQRPVAVIGIEEPSPVAVVTPPADPVADPGPVQAHDLNTRMLSATPPRYPLESRRRKEEGTVLLSLILDVNGRVSAISIAGSSGFPRLDKAALQAVRKWRWAPTLRDGKPVRVKGEVEIPFVLQR